MNPILLLLAAGLLAAAGETPRQDPTIPVAVREHVVFDGETGWAHGGVTYRLACGAVLCQAPNGDLLCWWLSGSDREPATDNNVLLCRSVDEGQTWGEPEVFIKAGDMAGALTCACPTGDRRIIVFGARWPSEMRYTVWHYFRMESSDSGHTWTAPQPISVHDDHLSFGNPIRLANGEYLFAASFFEQRPRALAAPVAQLLHAKSEAEALAMPAAPGPVHDNKFLTHLHGCSVLISEDQNASAFSEYGHIGNRPLGLLEPTCIQLKDGRLVMLMRAELAGFLWRAESVDNGRTWTDAWQTDIPNPTSLAQLTRLPDGRIVLLHNACGEAGKMTKRDPLSLWISDDEMKSWCIKADILSGGWLAYPNGRVLEDGRFVFAYDRNRRQIRFVEVDLPANAGP